MKGDETVTPVILPRRAYAATLLVLPALLFTLAAPVAAETPALQDCGPSLAFLGAESPEAVLFGAEPAPQRGGSIGQPGALSTCTAQCGDGSTVTCSGETCSAHDTNCDIGEDGYCEGTESGRKDCPPDSCPEQCFTRCWDGSVVSCEGYDTCTTTSSDCESGVRGQCYGDVSGTNQCPYCPLCDDQTLCSEKDGSSCSFLPPGADPDCTLPSGECGSCTCDGFEWSCS